MIKVCSQHVTKGLNLFPVPHVKILPSYAIQSCYFCEKKASVKLYMPLESPYKSKAAAM
ncbi:hypothetical protein V7266_06585 [Neobacillus drentensis]|uniref:hypothetical protein n=1 Tax=Neobacillus drentensis TaxID=220684 RepID=UPI002FFF724F